MTILILGIFVLLFITKNLFAMSMGKRVVAV